MASLERRLQRLRRERDQFGDRLDRSQGLEDQVKEAESEQAAAAEKAAAAEPLQQELAKLADQLGQTRSAAEAYKIADQTLGQWRGRISLRAV